jgi:hypothetical protein
LAGSLIGGLSHKQILDARDVLKDSLAVNVPTVDAVCEIGAKGGHFDSARFLDERPTPDGRGPQARSLELVLTGDGPFGCYQYLAAIMVECAPAVGLLRSPHWPFECR